MQRRGLGPPHIGIAQFQTEHTTISTHDFGEIQGGKARTCAEIEHVFARMPTSPLPGGAGRGVPELVLKAKPLQLFGMGAEQRAGIGHGCRGPAGQSSGKSKPASSSASTS